MSGTFGNYHSDVSNVAGIEQQLALELSIAAKAVDHMDCFDAEQRSEIYTILQTLRHDTAAHCTLVGQWVRDRKEPLGEPRTVGSSGSASNRLTSPSGLGGATQRAATPEGNGYA
jgi:hypothetical protein